MASGHRLQRIATQAWETFRLSRNSSQFTKNLAVLTENLSKLSASDLNIDPQNLPRYSAWATESGYMEMGENKVLSMGVFTLRKAGVTIPLHDHPGMYGVLKVVYGQVRITSYSRVQLSDQGIVPKFAEQGSRQPPPDRLAACRLASDALLDSKSDAVVLSPDEGNIHSIEAIDGPAAFVDILSPPYDPPERDCHYYDELEAADARSDSEKVDFKWLLRVSHPTNGFQCETEHYPGPSVHIGT